MGLRTLLGRLVIWPMTRTFGFANTVAVVEDGLFNDFILKGKCGVEHSDEVIILIS